MVAKKNKKSQKPAARAKLDAGQQSILQSWLSLIEADREAALAELMDAVEEQTALAEAMALGLGKAGNGAAAWIAELASAAVEDKTVKKALKKSAYQLRNKGLGVKGQSEGGIFKAPQTPPAKGYLTGYHPDGNQLIYLCLTSPGGRSAGGALVIHFVNGIREASLAHMKPGQLEDMVSQTGDELSLPPAEIEEADLAWLLAGALELGRGKRSSLNTESQFISSWLAEKKFQSGAPAPIWARMGLEADGQPQVAALRRLRELLEEDLCQMWWVDMDRWSQARPKLEQGLDSGLVLSPAQQAEKMTQALSGLKPVLFPPEEMPCWRRRLVETALYMESKGRPEDALAFLNAAMDLDHPENPLFETLMTRVWTTEQALQQQMALAGDEPEGAAGAMAEPEPEEGGGLILPPGVKA